MQTTRSFENGVITSQSWQLDEITVNHNIIDYNSLTTQSSSNNDDVVRMHFGLGGSYKFAYRQLQKSYHLHGQHNNIMYSQGLDIEVENLESRIETLGINFNTSLFVKIAQQGNDILKRMADDVLYNRQTILSDNWRASTAKMSIIIQDILDNPHQGPLRDLFLYSKSIELLVLQAEQYAITQDQDYMSSQEKDMIIAARDLLANHIDTPPTLQQLSQTIGLSEYKLKRGFKSLFGMTAYGYVNTLRLEKAKILLLETDRSAKEIAYNLGFSSPQHFSKAFKRLHGVPPKSIRSNPS